MVPFNLEIELENTAASASIEQLDRLADEDGFIRFDVTCCERRSVIYVNVENDVPPVTPQGAEAYFEAVHYPEQPLAFSEEEVFSRDEMQAIGHAIRKYNRELNSGSGRLMSQP
ncbi:hypothetical protein AB6735_24185 [Mucilaginibacter sp. RCC_168]|uniref:hypothetical protein n=1 Tax=Mucilaginibacter sp. RCC_168 TaxID=3239221 RepID=UPI0035267D24